MDAPSRANIRKLDTSDVARHLGQWSSGSGPLYRQLAERLNTLIGTGVLRAGELLPPERTLAATLSVSRGTVVSAYDSLRDAGAVAREQGRGTTIRALEPVLDAAHAPSLGETLFQPPPESIDLLVAVPDALDRVLRTVEGVDLGAAGRVLASSEPAGLTSLRTAIADHITAQGLQTGPGEVIVTAGAQQGIALVVSMMVRPGDVVLTEALTWPGLADSARRLGARVIGVPMDEHGIVTRELRAAVDRFRPTLIGLNPHHHNPTGTRLPPSRREEVAAIAADYQVPVIEDRVSAPLAFDGVVPPPIAAHDPAGLHIVVDSLSKVAWPGLRIGWVRAAGPTVGTLRSGRALLDMFSPIPSQLMAEAVLGDYEAILADRRAQLETRSTLVIDTMRRELPDWTLPEIRGGLMMWVPLPYGSASDFGRFAAANGVAVAGGREFSSSTFTDDHVRIPFTAPEADLVEAVRRLARAWAEFPTGHVEPSSPVTVV